MESVYLEITVIICLSAVLAIVFRALKQPIILAYILTGVILGLTGHFQISNREVLQSLGELGVTFLLFMLGLELKLRELKTIGFPAVIIGLLQMWFSFVVGFFIAFLLGFGTLPAVYIGLALSFSSTIMIVKNLSDRKDLNSLHGKLSIGILLMQDFFAVLTIILLSGLKPDASVSVILTDFGFIMVKAVLLFSTILFASIHIVPHIVHRIARSHEALFLFSLAWVFALTALVTSPYIGFSIEIGGFLAGLALANCAENFQIVARIKALRDFFITIFYVMIGLSMSFANLPSVIGPAVIFFLFVFLIKPLMIMLLVAATGYRKRTSFLVGSNMGQVSEFSFILLFLGNKLGVVDNSTVTMVLFVGILGFLGSTYVMKHANSIYRRIDTYLDVIETEKARKGGLPDSPLSHLKSHIVIIGGHQMGQSLLNALKDSKEQIVVVDFDPDIIKRLQNSKLEIRNAKQVQNHNEKSTKHTKDDEDEFSNPLVVFGDVADPEIHERVNLDKAKLVISTVPDLEDNLLLLESLNHGNKGAKVVTMALENEDAKIMYKAGADYVILPHLAGGRYLAKMLKDQELEHADWHKARDLAYIS